MSSYQSLKDRQVGRYIECQRSKSRLLTAIASLKRILNLNHGLRADGDPHDGTVANGAASGTTNHILNEDGEPIWKVLVFDNLGRDVISSVLRVNDLRDLGITIHLYVTQAVRPPDIALRRMQQRRLTGDGQKHQPTATPHPGCSGCVSHRTDGGESRTRHQGPPKRALLAGLYQFPVIDPQAAAGRLRCANSSGWDGRAHQSGVRSILELHRQRAQPLQFGHGPEHILDDE